MADISLIDAPGDHLPSRQTRTESEAERTSGSNDGDNIDSLQQRLLFGQQRHIPEATTKLQRFIADLRERSAQVSCSMLAIGRELFVCPTDQDNLVTRNLFPTIRQLRYCSSSSSFLFRALPYYVVVWMLVSRIFAMVYSIPWMLVEIMGRTMYYLVKTGHLLLLPGNSWPGMAVGRAIAPAFFQQYFTFHTLRVLSASTGFSTNFVSEYIRDRLLFRQDARSRWITSPQSWTTWFHVCYGVFEALPGVVYYLLTRSIDVSKPYYDLNDPSSNNDKNPNLAIRNFMLADQTNRGILVKSTLVWIALCLISLFSLGCIFRIHAWSMSPSEPTIVDFSINKAPARSRFGTYDLLSDTNARGSRDNASDIDIDCTYSSLRQELIDSFKAIFNPLENEITVLRLSRKHVLRILRICIQLILLISCILGFISLAAWFMIRYLQNGDLFADWLARSLSEPDANISILGVLWDTFFWYNQVLWAYNPAWPVGKDSFAFSGLGPGARPKVW